MKKTYQLASLMAGIAISVCIVGCCSKAPKRLVISTEVMTNDPVENLTTNDINITGHYESIITADQQFIMDGVKYQVADIPAQLTKRNCDRVILFNISPESQMKRETLVQLIDLLIKNKYAVSIMPQSKYADIPIPRVIIRYSSQ